jgi:transcriptional regulator GlxA family with amidase domain
VYIEANLESKLGVDHLADGVALSKGHFSRAFRQRLGIPPMVYVATRRVERAKMMMTSTKEQLTVIALACGFSDQSHLNRAFRRLVGVSPGRWRRSNAEVVDSSWLRSIPTCK